MSAIAFLRVQKYNIFLIDQINLGLFLEIGQFNADAVCWMLDAR
jgi:hypothetical protein